MRIGAIAIFLMPHMIYTKTLTIPSFTE